MAKAKVSRGGTPPDAEGAVLLRATRQISHDNVTLEAGDVFAADPDAAAALLACGAADTAADAPAE